MLIAGPYSILEGSSLKLTTPSDTLFRAFGSNHVTIAYTQPANTDLSELIISPFPFTTWSDLWRIELDVLNRHGLLSQIIALLAKHRIETLSAEATILEDGNKGTLVLLADCSRYESRRDLDSSKRAPLSHPQLSDLHAFIATTFIKDLVFADDQTPRLRVRRVQALSRSHQALIGGTLPNHAEVVVRKGRIDLPEAILEQIQAPFGGDQVVEIRSTLLTDSKDRVMRALFSTPNRGVLGVRISLREVKGCEVPILLERLNLRNFDLVRCQLHLKAVVAQDPPAPQLPHDRVVLELTVRSTVVPPGPDDKLFNLIQTDLSITEELADCDLVVELMKPDSMRH